VESKREGREDTDDLAIMGSPEARGRRLATGMSRCGTTCQVWYENVAYVCQALDAERAAISSWSQVIEPC
jgi:hypothetical protein